MSRFLKGVWDGFVEVLAVVAAIVAAVIFWPLVALTHGTHALLKKVSLRYANWSDAREQSDRERIAGMTRDELIESLSPRGARRPPPRTGSPADAPARRR